MTDKSGEVVGQDVEVSTICGEGVIGYHLQRGAVNVAVFSRNGVWPASNYTWAFDTTFEMEPTANVLKDMAAALRATAEDLERLAVGCD